MQPSNKDETMASSKSTCGVKRDERSSDDDEESHQNHRVARRTKINSMTMAELVKELESNSGNEDCMAILNSLCTCLYMGSVSE